jgi:hypothetical protein
MIISGGSNEDSSRSLKQIGRADSSAPLPREIEEGAVQIAQDGALTADTYDKAEGQHNSEGALSSGASHTEAIQERRGSAGDTSSPSPQNAENEGQEKKLDPKRKEEELKRLGDKINTIKDKMYVNRRDQEAEQGELADIEGLIRDTTGKLQETTDEKEIYDLKNKFNELIEKREAQKIELEQLYEEDRRLQAELTKTQDQHHRLDMNDELPNDAEVISNAGWGMQSQGLTQRKEKLEQKRESLARSVEKLMEISTSLPLSRNPRRL